MFTSKVLKDRLDQKPFRPFRIKMSNGEAYDIPNQGRRIKRQEERVCRICTCTFG